jgi:hypothetical protein
MARAAAAAYSGGMTAAFSWVDLAALAIAAMSLVVTIAIFALGRRLTFRQQRERVRELEAKAWEVLKPMRIEGLNSKIIVMNVDRYSGYDGGNALTWRGHAYLSPEFIEIVHGGVEVILRGTESYYDESGRRTLTRTSRPAANVIEVGHIPWEWIEDISPDGDEFDGSAIFFVRYQAAGRQPYDFVTYREGRSEPFGPHNRDYYKPIPELGIRRPRAFIDRWHLARAVRDDRGWFKRSRARL